MNTLSDKFFEETNAEYFYSFKDFNAEYNNDLVGYLITFKDGKVAQTQLNTETNKLDADFGEIYLERYTEYDDELSLEQNEIVDKFIQKINNI